MQKLEENINENKNEKKQDVGKGKYFIETIDIREDSNMTRIYSIIYRTDFFSRFKRAKS